MSENSRKVLIILISLIIATEAIVVLTGWVLEIDALTRFLPAGINMAFSTALMFLLSSIGLYFIHIAINKYDFNFSPLVLTIITLLILLITVTIFFGTLLGINTGIGNLFFPSGNATLDSSFMAEMPAYSSMIGFIIFALACGLCQYPGRASRIQILALGIIISIIGLLAIVGYLFDFSLLYYKFNNTTIPMAINTAITFVLLGLCLIIIGTGKNPNEN